MDYKIQRDIFVCEMLEIKYSKLNGIGEVIDKDVYSAIFPPDWFSINDYRKKIEILSEAIEKGTTIINTLSYLDICEGVIDDYRVNK